MTSSIGFSELQSTNSFFVKGYRVAALVSRDGSFERCSIAYDLALFVAFRRHKGHEV